MADRIDLDDIAARLELIKTDGRPTGIVPIGPAERDALVAAVRAAQAQVDSERGMEHGATHDEQYVEYCYFDEETWPCATQRLRDALAPFGGDQ